MRHVIQTVGQDWPVTLTTHEGSLSGIVFIDAGGYEDIEVPISAIPRLIDALQAIYVETTTEEVPENIAESEWPDGDEHLREWEWIDCDGSTWRWYELGTNGYEAGWAWRRHDRRRPKPTSGPWTRGERVK